MRREVSRLAIMLLIGISACSKQDEGAVLARLESDSPIVQDKLNVSDCKIDDKELNDVSPIRAKRNEPMELTGVLVPKEWELGGIFNGWKEDGEPGAPRAMKPNARQLNISLLVHGNDITKRFGVVEGVLIETRPMRTDPSEYEFRAKFKAPSAPGKYVVDLQAQDMSARDQGRSEPLTKPFGFPIWRREIWVE